MQFNTGTYDIIIASDEQALEEVKLLILETKILSKHNINFFFYFTASYGETKDKTQKRQRIGSSTWY